MYNWYDSYVARVVTEERLRDRTIESIRLVPAKSRDRIRPSVRSFFSILF